MAKGPEAIVNPEMLVWARKKCGYDLLGAARKISVKPERLEEWENGHSLPTIKQAMKMAEVYRRPLSAFYLNEPPKDFSVAMTDFRRSPDVPNIEHSPELIREIQTAQIRRDIMLDLSVDESTGIFEHANTVNVSDDPSEIALRIRGMLQIDWATQQSWRDQNTALNGWRSAIESVNVLVFHTNHLGNVLQPLEAHGFSISEHRFPIIVINSKDAHARRTFTLLHEFAHLLVDSPGICDTWEYLDPETSKQKTEVFCNHVAGNVLVPTSLLVAHSIIRIHSSGVWWSETEIETLAKDFSSSKEVIVRRLLTLGLTTHSFYEAKRREYQEAFNNSRKQDKSESKIIPYDRMALRNVGKPFARQVLSAYYDNQITLSDVSNYLGVKIKHIKPMESAIFARRIGD